MITKHTIYLKYLFIFLIPTLYFSLVPYKIVKYGIENEIKAFYNGAAFIEIFQVFSVFWVISHLLGGGLLFCLYMIFYGCDKANNNS
jgi:hypothetical protein